MKSKENAYSRNQSAEKALLVIEHLAQKGNAQRLQDISREMQMNQSTLIRFLATLQEMGYVDQEADTSKYYLTLKICSVANQVSANLEIRDIVRPYLKTISATLKESVCFAIEQDKSVVYIEVIQGPNQLLKATQRIGNRAPMYCTGIGKLLLLEHSESYIDQMIEQHGLQRFTNYTLITKDELMAELSLVRRRGYAYDNEECELGVRCISFPLRDFTGKIIAGLSISGPSFHIQELDTPETISYLRQTSSLISKKLGYCGESQ